MANGIIPGKAFIRQWGRAVVAGYLVVGAFGGGYLVTTVVVSDSAVNLGVVVGVLVAAPLAVAFVWGRLTAVKAFGVEFSLGEATVPVEGALAEALSAHQYFSGAPHLLKQISEAVHKPDLQLIEINLRSVPYWWSTRLYLQAALLDDHSQVRRLVFVEGDNSRRYVGMATPRAVRRAMTNGNPALETRYREIVTELAQVQPPEADADPVEASIYRWGQRIVLECIGGTGHGARHLRCCTSN